MEKQSEIFEYKYFEFEWDYNVLGKNFTMMSKENRLIFIQNHMDKLATDRWEVLRLDESWQGTDEWFKIEIWAKRRKVA